MKNGWQTKPLVDLCEVFADGDWIESKDQSPNGIRLIQTGNVGEGVFKDRGEKARHISEATFKRLRCTEIFEGDCLISRLPDPAGRSCLLPDTSERMITAVDCTIVRFNRKQVLPEFFNYYSQSRDYLSAVDGETTGTTRKRISRSKLAQTLVPIPSLPEQWRIVGILDEAFEGIATAKANAEKNLQNARALFESYLNFVFFKNGNGWATKRLGDACLTGAGGTPLKSRKEYYEGGKIPWLMSGEVNQGEVYSATRFITQSGLDHSSAKIFPKNTVLVAMYGATAGAVGILRFEAATNQAVCGILPNDKFIPEFIYYALLSKKRELIDQATGNAQPNISQIKIKNTSIPVIAITEQRRIVDALNSISTEIKSLESIYQSKLDTLEALKKSLLHQAFTGELSKVAA